MTPSVESTPEEMRGRWALCAALTAAQGWPEHCHARENTWHYDDGGGNWADLRLLTGARAVLLGHDHEYSETYFRGAAEYFGEPETDLLAGLPDWAADAISDYVADIERSGMWIGFVYAFDSGTWSQASYDVPDGFSSLDLPPVSEAATVEHLSEFLAGIAADQGIATDRGSDEGIDLGAVRAAVAQGAAVTDGHLRAMFGARDVDISAGIAAARRFVR